MSRYHSGEAHAEELRRLRREMGVPEDGADDEVEQLVQEQARLRQARKRTRRTLAWIGASVLAAGGVVKGTGLADTMAARVVERREPAILAQDPRVPGLQVALEANAKRTANVERLVRWLVRQEIRRQIRAGEPLVEPPEDAGQ